MSVCNYRSESEEVGRRSCRDGCVDSPAVPSRRRRRRRDAAGGMCFVSLVIAVAASAQTHLPLVAARQQPAANKEMTRDLMRRSRDRGAKLRGLGWHGLWEPSALSGKSGKTSKSSSKTGKVEHDASWWASSSGDLPVSTPRPTPPTTTGRPTAMPTQRATTKSPTKPPTRQPFASPTESPTEAGSNRPSIAASQLPSISPTIDGTNLPSGGPTQHQSAAPSISHSALPSTRPSVIASAIPSGVSSAEVSSLEPTPPVLGPGEVPSRFDVGSGNNTTAPISATPAPTVSPSTENNGTLVPTREDTSDGLPLGDVQWISPPPLESLELDLFGLDTLDEERQRQFEEQTAAYIASFYNEDAASDEDDDLRSSIVSNVTAEMSVTDHRPPDEGPTFGFNCADIDPLTVVFSVELTYSSSESDVKSGDVVAYPFSKNRFRQQFLYDYLVADSDEFSSVQCVSGVYLPSGTEYPTYAPTGGPEEDGESKAPTLLVQSSSPTMAPAEMELTDDIFLDMRIGDDAFSDLRFTEPTTKERKCNDKLRKVPRGNIDELEVSFVYAVETASGDDGIVEYLETLLLDLAAVSVLRCDGSSEAQAAHLWRSRDAEFNGVVRVRYPEFGELTSRSECEPATSRAKECLVLTSRFLVTSVGTPESEVHREVLVVLADAFRKGTVADFVPGVVSMSYLGPDPEAVDYLAASDAGGTGGGPGAATIAVAVLFSIGCASLLLWAALPTTRILVASKATSCWGRVKERASRTNHVSETARRLNEEDNYRERVAPYSDPAEGVVGSYRDTAQTPYTWRQEY